ncbi:hypothetical protein Prudu_017343 [Prunus dulcis]|uniref:Alcohol dehydrogenase-like C-terminal domain-containing protein n=1 Tax=Prunus dulcis TaxID=3755 RepID=A0A4Y1RNL3_PRUDU|nr:hypothetical protein Prudu_017343 [Prunus dulcis]
MLTELGSKVEKFKVGDKNYCPELILTYGEKYHDRTTTYGGYSDFMVVDEHFIVRIPDNLPLDGAAPLFCAGITTYSPLRYFELDKPGMHVGVVGLGGVGHLAVKFAKAMGVKVTVISTSPNKEKEAIEHLHADSFIVIHDQDQMQAAMGTMDGIIDTSNGKLVMVTAPEKNIQIPAFSLLMGRKMVAGSRIRGMKETQKMVDFAVKHNITADIEVIPVDYLNTAMERLAKSDVKYRFVIDIGNTLKSTS